ncbi:wax ester/triacylglycerol synthase domain-containing protein [Nocardioides sp. WV_118_6]
MSVTDASFLYSEDGSSHNDVGMVLVLDGPAPTRVEIMRAIADRIALVPRFRQKVRHLPLAAGLPVWIDDVAFDVDRHVRERPAQRADDPVGQAVSRIMSVPMDLTRPLWEVHLVPGLPDEQWLLVVRMHHAMVDGVNSTEIVRLLLSPDPAGEPPVVDNWRPRPDVPDHVLLGELARDAWTDTHQAWAEAAGGRWRPPDVPTSVDLTPFTPRDLPLPPLLMNGPVQVGRHYGLRAVPLGVLREIRAALGGTVNDVLLAACGHGFGTALHEHLGAVVEGRGLRTMVPVSLSSERTSTGGNEIGAMVVEIPLGPMPAAARLARISEQTAAFKRLKDAVPANAINGGSSLTSPLTLILGSRMAASAPTFVNTVVTNVPGPQNPLYLLGRRLDRLGACIALWAPLRMAVSVLSYDGTATINAVTDEGSFPTVAPLLDGIAEGLDELLLAARAAG